MPHAARGGDGRQRGGEGGNRNANDRFPKCTLRLHTR